MDYGNVVVHIFTQEARDFYDLDRLWADGVKTDWQEDRFLMEYEAKTEETP